MELEAYRKLELEWGAFCGAAPGTVVACNSGTAALHLALEGLRLPRGAGVVLPDFTMVACARAVALAGLEPVFVDCGADLNVSPEALCRAVEREVVKHNPRAVMMVHVYGRAARSDLAADLCEKYDLALVEDMAEATGLPPHPRCDAAAWSFYRNKVVCGEEGGAVAFRAGAGADVARCLRSMGFGPDQDYQHERGGHNYRLANLLAEPVRASLRDYPNEVARRRANEAVYDAECPAEWRMPARDVPWAYDFRVPGLGRRAQDLVVRTLKAEGYPARHAFKPMSDQDEFRWCRKYSTGGAARAAEEVVYLGLGGPPPADPGRPFRVVRDVVARLASARLAS